MATPAHPHAPPNASAPVPAWRDGLSVLAFGAVYTILFVSAAALPFHAGEAAAIWPADGLAVGVLMRVRYRLWPAYLLMILLANALGGHLSGFTVSLSGFVGLNVAQPALTAWLMRRYFDLPEDIDTVRGIAAFALVVMLCTGASSALGALDPALSAGSDYLTVMQALFVSDALGIVIVAPLVLTWSREERRHLRAVVARREVEAVLLLVGLVASTHLVFSLPPNTQGWVPQMQHLTIPFLLWPALRFGMRGSTLALAIYTAMTFAYTVNGFGPFAASATDARVSLVALQVYLGFIAVMILIGAALMSERRVAEVASESWRTRFEAAIEAGHSLVFEIHPASGRIEWGGDTRQVLGLAPHEIATTRAWTSRVHPDDRSRLTGVRARLASGALPSIALEYRVRHGSGRDVMLGVHAYSIAAPSSPLSPGYGTGRRIIGFVKDITERTEAESERRRLEAELRQAQKMEAIGQLAGGIAHDFNNILGSILGYGEMARQRAGRLEPADPTLNRQLDTILKAGERGRILVSQILTYSRKEPRQHELLDLDQVLDEVVTLVKGSNPHEVVYMSDQAGAPEGLRGISVRGNATELHQLFMNLAINGVQAMPGGGVLEVGVDAVTLERPHTVMQRQLPAGHYARITVTDHGEGIDAPTMARMFEPFFTTKPTGRGTGLGLSLAMSIAKSHGGGIDVASRVGEGTTFTVYLPAAGFAQSAAAGEALPRGGGQRILLVDDEAPLRELAEEILVELGYETAAHGSGDAALAAFEADPAHFDAVLTDEVMPGLTGTQLAAALHAKRPALPVLIITGYGGPGFEMRAQQAGVAMVLRKPYQKRELAQALAAALKAAG